jgi:hypothetical protein
MTGRATPAGLGLVYDWGDGFNGYGDQMDANLLKLSVFGNKIMATDFTATTPVSPTAGDIIITTTAHATQPDKVGVFDNIGGAGSWTWYTPREGDMAWVMDDNLLYIFNGTNWVEYNAYFGQGRGLAGSIYDVGTKSAEWTVDPTNGLQQKFVNGGAHTLNAPSVGITGFYELMLLQTNNASAGAISWTGFTKTSGDALTTTDGHKFMHKIIVQGSNILRYTYALQ